MNGWNWNEQFETLQRSLLPTSAVPEAVARNACQFWQSQEKLLAAMETFSRGWFERRHRGTRAALEASERMCQADTPVEALRAYQEWLTGASERLIADGLACQREWMTFGSVLAPSPTSPAGSDQVQDGGRPERELSDHPKAA
ncbi:MAG: hypothetical protein DPW22_07935 [Alphaproteobacteria bacterium]|nr:hypothetical protein [Alphaproteobacteria bacterium]